MNFISSGHSLRYVGLMWSLCLIGDLYLSGGWQGFGFRVLGFRTMCSTIQTRY